MGTPKKQDCDLSLEEAVEILEGIVGILAAEGVRDYAAQLREGMVWRDLRIFGSTHRYT